MAADVWRFLGQQGWVSEALLDDFIGWFNAQWRGRWLLEWHEVGPGGEPLPTLELVHMPSGHSYFYVFERDWSCADGPLYALFSGYHAG